MVGFLHYRTISTANKYCSNILSFVPTHSTIDNNDILKIKHFITSSSKLLVLTGAGVSTESGIPDYRSEGVGLYARSTNRPVQYQDFVKNKAIRRRYWARNYVGWPRFSSFHPNTVHSTLRDLELKYKLVSCIVTQNVDNLHTKAGSKSVIELHGSAFINMPIIFKQFWKNYIPHMKGTSKMIRAQMEILKIPKVNFNSVRLFFLKKKKLKFLLKYYF
ncbi:hypothetical protein L9F63_003525 [Diploptera punctata]|uniref:Deacetylase sirtuin-type domain-containing protein n=1 Tax=Diploptera punctata TaxID=6984 RepID=A0AAD8E9B6_DIPPU|nr:hypothetical protein L9F63_003525 [Diploptera punctata]